MVLVNRLILPICSTKNRESFKAYAVAGHRHTPEIAQMFSMILQISLFDLTLFHILLPIIKGGP